MRNVKWQFATITNIVVVQFTEFVLYRSLLLSKQQMAPDLSFPGPIRNADRTRNVGKKYKTTSWH